jgi:hypothetical protein
MRRISSGGTWFSKWIIPIIFLGLFAVFLSKSIFDHPLSNWAGLQSLLTLIVVMVIFFFIWKKSIFDLVDEVWEDDDTLIVKNRGQQQRIDLADIKNINYNQSSKSPRVTLSLRRPTIFGDQISFVPIGPMLGGPSPVINELIDRVDAAHQERESRSVGRR